MTNLSPQLCTPLLAHAWRRTQSSLGLVRSSQKSWPAVDRSGLPSLSKLAQGVAWIICHFHAAWDRCIYPTLIKKEGIRKQNTTSNQKSLLHPKTWLKDTDWLSNTWLYFLSQAFSLAYYLFCQALFNVSKSVATEPWKQMYVLPSQERQGVSTQNVTAT